MTQFPKTCPLDPPLETSVLLCAPCAYSKHNKFANTTWCQVDRIDKGLPEMTE